MSSTHDRLRASRFGTALALVAALALPAACGGTGDQASPSASPAASPSSSGSPTIPMPSGGPRYTGVYFLVDSPLGIRLVVEEHRLPAGPMPVAAVRAMIAGPVDRDYVSPWNPRTRVLGVHRHAGVVTVNLSPAARRANAGSEVAERMVQQLVHTVDATQPDQPKVLLLIGGRPAGDLWGVVSWTRPIAPADPLDVRLPVQIGTPADGATVTGPVHVIGEAAVFEAQLAWRVLDEHGRTVRAGTATTDEAMVFSLFSFTVRLRPGTYTVEVLREDPSGGMAGPPVKDTRTITVR